MLSDLDSNSEPVPAALLADFLAYDQGFTGGVNVGTLSADLHGKPSVITGPGVGYSSLLKSYDLAAQAVIDSFFAYDPQFQGGVYVGGA
jgi:serralysin